MNMNQFIELGIDEELAKKCETLWEEELANYVPKQDLDDANTQLQTLTEANQKQLNQIHQIKLDNTVDNAIKDANGKNAKAIRALLNFDEIKLDENNQFTGINEQLQNLQTATDSDFLFKANDVSITGATIGESGDNSTGEVDTSKMTYSELAAYMASNAI